MHKITLLECSVKLLTTDIKEYTSYNINQVPDSAICNCCGGHISAVSGLRAAINGIVGVLVIPALTPDRKETAQYWTEAVELNDGTFLNVRHLK